MNVQTLPSGGLRTTPGAWARLAWLLLATAGLVVLVGDAVFFYSTGFTPLQVLLLGVSIALVFIGLAVRIETAQDVALEIDPQRNAIVLQDSTGATCVLPASLLAGVRCDEHKSTSETIEKGRRRTHTEIRHLVCGEASDGGVIELASFSRREQAEQVVTAMQSLLKLSGQPSAQPGLDGPFQRVECTRDGTTTRFAWRAGARAGGVLAILGGSLGLGLIFFAAGLAIEEARTVLYGCASVIGLLFAVAVLTMVSRRRAFSRLTVDQNELRFEKLKGDSVVASIRFPHMDTKCVDSHDYSKSRQGTEAIEIQTTSSEEVRERLRQVGEHLAENPSDFLPLSGTLFSAGKELQKRTIPVDSLPRIDRLHLPIALWEEIRQRHGRTPESK